VVTERQRPFLAEREIGKTLELGTPHPLEVCVGNYAMHGDPHKAQ
jgi:hypothetical protein